LAFPRKHIGAASRALWTIQERVVFAMSVNKLLVATLTLLLVAALGAAQEQEQPGDLQPVAPLSRTRLMNFQNYGGGMEQSFALTPDGKRLAMAGHNFLVMYDLSGSVPFAQPRHVPLDNVFLYNAAISSTADGKTLVCVPSQHGQDNTVRFVDMASGKLIREIDNDQPFFGLAVSPDAKVLALGGQQHLELWDAVSGDELRIIAGPANTIFRQMTFSADGRTLAAAAGDTSVVLFEVATGKERQKLRMTIDGVGPANPRFRQLNNGMPLTAVAFSPDGRLLAVGGTDSAVHLYDLATAEELPPLTGHLAAIRALVFTPHGKQMISFDAEGVKQTWSTGQFRKAASMKLPTLTDSELEDLWHDLAEADSFHTYRTMRHLSADPKRAVALLRRHVQPAPAGDSARIAQLVNDLQNPSAAVRRKAMAELRKHGEAAYGALSQANDGRGNQTVQILMNKLEAQANTPERMRSLKAVQVLERIGTKEAKELVEKLAGGAMGVPLTIQAKAALERWSGPGAKSVGGPTAAETLWADLGSEDAARAYRAIHGLVAIPQKALLLFREHLKPSAAPDLRQIDRSLADLDSNDYATRQKASADLARLGVAAEPALKKVLAGKPSAEVRRRVGELLERIKTNDMPVELLRGLRALEVLERLDARDTEPLLEALARGAPTERLTQEARASLARVSRRSAFPGTAREQATKD
jgi:hypothetical protein